MIAAIHITVGQVAATLALVAVAIAVSVWQRADLERDIGIAVIRSAIQLTAIGYVIKFIFEQNNLGLVVALLAAMVLFGALTARSRARKVPHAFWPLLIALALAAAATLGLVLALGVFKPQARYLVPVGGMVIGNAMTAAAVALNRLGDDVTDSIYQIEATLALGATSTQAIPRLRHPPALQPNLRDRPPRPARGRRLKRARQPLPRSLHPHPRLPPERPPRELGARGNLRRHSPCGKRKGASQATGWPCTEACSRQRGAEAPWHDGARSAPSASDQKEAPGASAGAIAL